MAKINTLKEFFDGKYNEIETVGAIDSKGVYNMEDYVELNKLDHQANLNDIQLGNMVRVPQVDNGGFLKSTPRERYVVNEEIAFINRVRVNEDKTINIVIDYRAVQDQSSGNLYTTSVVSYKIGKNKDKYAVLSVENIPENEFINEFTESLKLDSSKLMYEIITHHKQTGTNTGIDLDSVFA